MTDSMEGFACATLSFSLECKVFLNGELSGLMMVMFLQEQSERRNVQKPYYI